MDTYKEKIANLSASRSEIDDEVEAHVITVKEFKKRAGEYTEKIVQAKREAARAETSIEALRAKRHDYLKKCKVIFFAPRLILFHRSSLVQLGYYVTPPYLLQTKNVH
jgi:uncharacterized coiled-coil DUF342 family protein